ncbi:pyridoxamine 5'-phosphate oxidase family protein [Actinoplanes friuliensis]|uniref:Pyridoxamine 5'-phosphate oxidase-related FMN-binding protein n=1 Tax=Actinoplanes friuliensis DSM 7358 TaxID=1246995 RepID=U5VX60_9ACTN|nr:pyridoxamine 5'-phosphate oxidase family protein [Actinoplanes friuliensis]AGZ40246.1 pyridoxamine 5'-phosphate oxidase-related FMN- binding protein [Actinoplanes friuliensis DSM 7358]
MFRDGDLELLGRPLYAFLTVAPKGERWPAPRPVWFEVTTEGDLQMFSLPDSPKVDRLRENPRASVVVSAPTGEPEHWVSVEGTVTLHDDGGPELTTRLAGRYWDVDDPKIQKLLQEWRDGGVVRLVLHPEKVSRYSV